MSGRIAIVVCGNAGSGKSTLAARIAAERAAVLIDIDTCTERLARLVLTGNGADPDDRDSPEYKGLLREPVYETLFDIARANLATLPCVIVGPFTRERRDPAWPGWLEHRLGSSVEIVYVHCDVGERRRRIEARKNPRDRNKLADWENYAALGHDDAAPPFPHTFIDTTRS